MAAIAKRYIDNDDGIRKILFDEKCVCRFQKTGIGKDVALYIEKKNAEYATCRSCLRVYRIMQYIVPEGMLTIWGIYFDPYLANTLAGQFINEYIEPLDEKRFPRGKVKP